MNHINPNEKKLKKKLKKSAENDIRPVVWKPEERK
jgi:hypothetical protein